MLRYLPFLLPIMWIIRCFDIAFNQKKRLKRYFDTMKQIDSTKLDENKQALYVVGLSYERDE